MKILKVIVDEMPQACLPCDFCCDGLIMCALVDRELISGYEKIRPDWCPLVTTGWVLNELHSPFRDWDWDEDMPQGERKG